MYVNGTGESDMSYKKQIVVRQIISNSMQKIYSVCNETILTSGFAVIWVSLCHGKIAKLSLESQCDVDR